MATPPNYRQLAERNLDQATAQLGTLPNGRVPSGEVLACSAKAQAVATIAVAQALIEIADAIQAQTPTDTNDRLEALAAALDERDQAYRERAHLIAWLAALHPAVIAPAPDVDDPGWQILYLTAGGSQMSWHIASTDAELFADVEHVDPDDPRAQWDGHTTGQKYERIRQHVEALNDNTVVLVLGEHGEPICTCTNDQRCPACPPNTA